MQGCSRTFHHLSQTLPWGWSRSVVWEGCLLSFSLQAMHNKQVCGAELTWCRGLLDMELAVRRAASSNRDIDCFHTVFISYILKQTCSVHSQVVLPCMCDCERAITFVLRLTSALSDRQLAIFLAPLQSRKFCSVSWVCHHFCAAPFRPTDLCSISTCTLQRPSYSLPYSLPLPLPLPLSVTFALHLLLSFWSVPIPLDQLPIRSSNKIRSA